MVHARARLDTKYHISRRLIYKAFFGAFFVDFEPLGSGSMGKS